MTTLNQTLRVAGQSLSNNDPDLVITLDNHPVVQISSIQDESITYSFSGRVNKPVTIELNLSFTYKNVHTLVVPLTFTQNATAPNIISADTPITVAMWATGNEPPFVLTLDGSPVTNQIANLTVLDNSYVKPDSLQGVDKKVWEILYADVTAGDKVVPFSYKFIVDDVEWEYTSEGTFRLPAWDGVAFKPVPATEGDTEFTDLRIKKGATHEMNIALSFKGHLENNAANVVRKPELDDLVDGAVSFTDQPSDGLTRPVSITALKTGWFQPKFYYERVNLGGYPASTDKLTQTYWSPGIQVWDDPLTINPDITTFEGHENDTGEIVPNIKYMVTPINPDMGGLQISFAPEGIILVTGLTDTSIQFTFVKSTTVDVTDIVTMSVSYGGESNTADFSIKTLGTAIPIPLTVSNVTETITGKTGDVVPFNFNLSYGDAPLASDAEGVTYTIDNTSVIEIIGPTPTGISVKLLMEPVQESQWFIGTVTAWYNGSRVWIPISGTVLTAKIKPTIINTPVDCKIWDTGTSPFRVMSGETDITSSLVLSSKPTNQYIDVTRSNNTWSVYNALPEATSTTVNYIFEVIDNDFAWEFEVPVVFNIAAWDGHYINLVSQGEKIVGGNGDSGVYPVSVTLRGKPALLNDVGFASSVLPGGAGVLTGGMPVSNGLSYSLMGILSPGKMVSVTEGMRVSYNSGEVSDHIDISIPVDYTSQPVEVTGMLPSTVRLGDTIIVNPTVELDGFDVKDDWTGLEIVGGNEYLEVTGKNLLVIKDEVADTVVTVTLRFTGTYGVYTWSTDVENTYTVTRTPA